MLSSDNEIVLLAAFAAITEADCIDWIKHCGYKQLNDSLVLYIIVHIVYVYEH